MDYWRVLYILLGCTGTFIAIMLLMVGRVLRYMYHSVGLIKPSEVTLGNDKLHDSKDYILFKYFPSLKAKLPYANLGNYPTPIDKATMKLSDGSQISFLVKREDLSSEIYGGNKVRTLLHQVPVCEEKMAQDKSIKDITVLGSGGSNQVLCTLIHAQYRFGLPVTPVWLEDAPDIDNTLNMLSCLSMNGVKDNSYTWDKPMGMLKKLLQGAFSGDNKTILSAPGGHCVAGVLGQMSGPLEVAEQILEKRSEHKTKETTRLTRLSEGEEELLDGCDDCFDLDTVYLAIGSSCTLTGIIMGIALCKTLKLDVFAKPGFEIKAIPIHHALAQISRGLDFYKSPWSAYVPLSVRNSIFYVSKAFKEMTGVDLHEASLDVLQDHVKIIDDEKIVGTYGAHSDRSQLSSNLFEQTGNLDIWLCGHFTGKALTVLLDDLLKSKDSKKNVLFWHTKSKVLPKGEEDEWAAFKEKGSKIHRWADNGKSKSLKRKININSKAGKREDYAHLMTPINNIGAHAEEDKVGTAML